MKNQLLTEKFKIRNRIDMGTDGLFDPGSESRLFQTLKTMKNGDKVFHHLINRKAVELIQPKPEPKKAPHPNKAKKEDGGKSGETVVTDDPTSDEDQDETQDPPATEEKDGVKDEAETSEEEAETTEASDEGEESEEAEETEAQQQDDEDVREATGEWRINHYGGGRHEIIDPDGVVIETGVRGEQKAQKRLEELKSKA